MRNLTPTNRLLLILTLSAVALIMGTASVFAADVNLMWDPSTSSSLSGYKLYYGTASRSYGTVKPVGNVTSNTVTGLNVGTYYFSATSVDSVGNESGFSNEVSQAVSAPCTYSLSLPGQSFGSGAGTGSVGVNAGSGCNWTAVSNAAWIGISAGASGSGPGTVSYTVQANTLTSSRSGTLTIAGVTFTITQTAAAPACSFTLSPASAS